LNAIQALSQLSYGPVRIVGEAACITAVLRNGKARKPGGGHRGPVGR
jgi:hypothetical protein